MRNSFGKLCVTVATIVLLFAAAFFTVSLVLEDGDSIEEQYKKQDVSAELGIPTPDLSRATTVMLDYMRGTRPNIQVSARVNGQDTEDLFSLEKEIVHMAEVQKLWLGLETFAKYGALFSVAVLLTGFLLIERGKKRAILSSGIFWGCGIFGGVLGFLGIWAIIDFSSFWTVFHFLIFPASLFQYLSAGATVQAMNELNWILPDTSYMVRMLLPIFPSIVLRCALIVIIEIVLVVIVAVFIRFAWRKQGTRSPVADIIVIDHDENEPVAIKGPDLVLSHKLSNAPVEKRGEILRRAKNGEPLEDPPKPFPEEETHPVGRLVPETEPSQIDVGDVDPNVPQSETDEVSNTASSEDPQ